LLAQQSDPSVSVRENRAKPKEPRHIQHKNYSKGSQAMAFTEVDVRFPLRYHRIMILASHAVKTQLSQARKLSVRTMQ